jgi:hypothetical protein
MVTRDQRVVVIIVGQVSRCHAQFQSTAVDSNFDLTFKVRLIDNWDGHRSVDVLKGSDKEIFRAADSLNANGSGSCKAEVSCKSPETARNFEAVVCEAHQDCVAASCLAGVILSTPPVQVARGVTIEESVVPR